MPINLCEHAPSFTSKQMGNFQPKQKVFPITVASNNNHDDEDDALSPESRSHHPCPIESTYLELMHHT